MISCYLCYGSKMMIHAFDGSDKPYWGGCVKCSPTPEFQDDVPCDEDFMPQPKYCWIWTDTKQVVRTIAGGWKSYQEAVEALKNMRDPMPVRFGGIIVSIGKEHIKVSG